MEEEVFENERYMPIRGWSSRNLLPTDRSRFTHGRSQGAQSTTEFPKVHLPDGEPPVAIPFKLCTRYLELSVDVSADV